MKKTMLVFTLAAALSGACLFAKEAKNALLIANGEYSHFSGLSEPIKEAENLCTALEQIGFTVKIVKNASLEEMNDALSDFKATLKKIGRNGIFPLRRTHGAGGGEKLSDSLDSGYSRRMARKNSCAQHRRSDVQHVGRHEHRHFGFEL